ncbi:MAG: THUMP domain-containing protein [Thermoplasmata archaeon]
MYLIRYSGEIALKSKPVRRELLKILEKNILNAFINKKIEMKLSNDGAHFYLFSNKEEETKFILKHTFGISSFNPVVETSTEENEIISNTLSVAKGILKEGESFGLRVKKSGNKSYSSMDIAKKGGAMIMKELKNIKVNLDNPDKEIHIEIRDKNSFIWHEKLEGPGGLPLGCEGYGLSIINNEESIVSAWLMMRRGVKTTVVTNKDFYSKSKMLENWQEDLQIYVEEKGNEINKALEIAQQKKLISISCHLELEELYKHTILFREYALFSPTIGLRKEDIEKYYNIVSN